MHRKWFYHKILCWNYIKKILHYISQIIFDMFDHLQHLLLKLHKYFMHIFIKIK